MGKPTQRVARWHGGTGMPEPPHLAPQCIAALWRYDKWSHLPNCLWLCFAPVSGVAKMSRPPQRQRLHAVAYGIRHRGTPARALALIRLPETIAPIGHHLGIKPELRSRTTTKQPNHTKNIGGAGNGSLSKIVQLLRGGACGRFVGPVARRDGRVARSTPFNFGVRV